MQLWDEHNPKVNCYNHPFSHLPSLHHRYASRSLIIPFKAPTIGPTTEEETAEFQQLGSAMKEASAAVGWVISIGKSLERGLQFQGGLLKAVREKLVGVDPRLCTSYCTLFYCVRKVG
jgi:hypothetical protein